MTSDKGAPISAGGRGGMAILRWRAVQTPDKTAYHGYRSNRQFASLDEPHVGSVLRVPQHREKVLKLMRYSRKTEPAGLARMGAAVGQEWIADLRKMQVWNKIELN